MKWRSRLRMTIDSWLNKGLIKKLATVFVATLAIFFVLGVIIMLGFPNLIPYAHGLDGNPLWQLYYYFADPGNQMSIGDNASDSVSYTQRWVGLIFSSLGSILLSGILISTITNGFEHMTNRWRSGLSYYKLRDHVVIIGSDQMVYGLVSQLCETSTDYIVVMTSADVDQIRNSLWALCKSSADKKRIIVNYGHRDSEVHLKKINVAYAKAVYILGNTSEFDNIESYHDSLNVECLNLIAKIRREMAMVDRLPCHVLFDYKTTYHVFQHSDPSENITSYIDFHPFNFYDLWARKVFVAGVNKEDGVEYKPLDYIPITSPESDRYVHLIIIGMSKMGQAMALQAAHIAHFPNYKRRKTKITIIDCNAKVEMNEFKQKCGELFKLSHSTYIDADAWLHAEECWVEGDKKINVDRFKHEYHIADEYRHLISDDNDPDFIDVEWEFINGYDHNPIVQRLLSSYVTDEKAIVTVAVCLNITHISLRSAMNLPKAYYEKMIPVLVQQRKTSSIVSTLNGLNAKDRSKLTYKNLYPFGKVTSCYDLQLSSSYEICKRVNYVYANSSPDKAPLTEIKDDVADKQWEMLAISKRWSNIFVASSIPTKLRSLGIKWSVAAPCHIEAIDDKLCAMHAEVEHNRWNVEELLLGYRPTYEDEDKDIDVNKEKKGFYKKRFIHYDIRPYDGLKPTEKGVAPCFYDYVIVRSLPLIMNSHKSENKS